MTKEAIVAGADVSMHDILDNSVLVSTLLIWFVVLRRLTTKHNDDAGKTNLQS